MTDPGDSLFLNGRLFSKSWILANHRNLSEPEFTPHEIAVLSFCGRWLSGQTTFSVRTSGSTGEPRTIELSRTQMEISARMTARALNLAGGDRALVCLSPASIAGLMMLVRGFEIGMPLTVVAPSANPFESLKEFDVPHATARFDFTALVPLQLQTILSAGQKDVSRLNEMKAVLIGGAPLSGRLLKATRTITAPVYHTFAMTETVTHIALRRLNGAGASERFRPLPGVEIGTDERGCLTVTAAVTEHKRVVTNDLVQIHPDRTFTWLGRIDNVINTGGVKVQAEKVERVLAEALAEMAIERDFFVAPLPDEKLGQIVVAVFQGPEFSLRKQSRLLEYLVGKLERYEMPKKFCFLQTLVRTGSGKIDRKANLGMLAETMQEGAN